MNLRKIAKRTTLTALLLSMFCVVSLAQNLKITGHVKDTTGEPVIGASVQVEGTSTGTITDFDGNFSLSAPSNGKLQFSFIGYVSQLIPINNQSTLNVTLKEDSEVLDEVVVIGYQTVRRKDLTGSVASVKGDAIAATPVSNVAQALQGKLPGVNIMSQDGRPDAEISIRVRGGGSISQSNDPLVLIDGIPGTIGDIPSDMVESIDVLKDASSTAIYGARGANGVILITTKKGKEGKISVSYSGYAKFNKPTKYIDALSPYDWLTYKWGILDEYTHGNAEGFERLFAIGSYGDVNAYKNVSAYDMQKEVYDSSFSHNHDLSISGGNDKTKILFAFNYMDEDGMKLNSYTKRGSASFKLDQKILNNLTFNLDARYTDRQTMGNEGTTSGLGSTLSGAYRFRPIATEDIKGDLDYLTDGTIANDERFSMWDLYSPYNIINDRENLTYNRKLRGTAGVNWGVVKGLTYRTELTLTRGWKTTKNWEGPTPSNGNQGTRYLNDDGTIRYAGDADYRKDDSWDLRWTNTLSYETTLKDIHRFNVVAGHEVTDSGGDWLRVQGVMYPANYTKENAFAMIGEWDKTNGKVTTSSGVTTPARILSFFGRANYTLMDKYMLTATFRVDGSSNFSPEHRWGYFPAAAFAWRMSEEKFLKPLNWLDDLKLRVSYGEVGNDAIKASQWSQLWAPHSGNNRYGINNSYMGTYDLASDQMANRNLKWETTITRNIGLDFMLLGNRLWGTIDVYHNTTKDLLMLTDIPTITGFPNTYANIGQTSNKGVELSLSGVIFKNKDWSITAGANINFNKGNIDKLAEDIKGEYGTNFLQSGIPNNDYILKVGKPVGIIMGWVSDGFYTTNDFTYENGIYTLKNGLPDLGSMVDFKAFSSERPAGQNTFPGLPKFKDVSGSDGNPDGIIDYDDYVQIGNTNPKHTGGFNVNVNYKNFDLGMYFNWSYGNDVYNANKLASMYNIPKGGTFANRMSIVNNSYKYYSVTDGQLVRAKTPAELDAINKSTTLPMTYLEQGYVSSWGIEDGSYLRLNTLTLGYTLPKALMSKIGINNLRVYGTINNLFTITGYSGLDPEVNAQKNLNNARYPTTGLDWGTYPRARQFVLGLNVSF